MEQFPEVITAENLESAWNYVSGKYRFSKKMCAIRSAFYTVSPVVFLVESLLLTYGLLYSKAGASIAAYLQQFSAIEKCWLTVKNFLFAETVNGVWGYCKTAVIAYLLPIAVSIPGALVIALLYYPIIWKKDRTPFQQAVEMARRAEMSEYFCQKNSGACSVICCLLYGMITAGVAIIYFIPGLGITEDAAEAIPSNYILIGIATIFVLITLEALLSWPMYHIVKLVLMPKLPQNYSQICKAYMESVRPERAESILVEAPSVIEKLQNKLDSIYIVRLIKYVVMIAVGGGVAIGVFAVIGQYIVGEEFASQFIQAIKEMIHFYP